MDEAYFRESLSEWIDSVSKVRKFEPLLCAVFGVIGAGTVLLFPPFRLVGYLALAVGLFEAWRYVSFKRRWLAARLSSKQHGVAMTLELGPGRVKQLAPPPTPMDPQALARVMASRRGYFVYPTNGAFVYIPHASIAPAVTREEVLRVLGTENWSGFATGAGET
jgi:hypothetical protein